MTLPDQGASVPRSDPPEDFPTRAPAPDAVTEQLAQAQGEQEARWQRGDHVLVEVLLAEHPELAAAPDVVLGLIVSELRLRQQAGEAPSADEYLRRFPALASALRNYLDARYTLEAGALAEHDRWQTRVSILLPAPEDLVPAQPPVTPATSPPRSPTDEREVEEQQPFAVPGYSLLGELGRGGMGVVYLAYDRQRKETVALKTMQRADAAALLRLKQEFRSLAGVTHPNLVALYELIADGGRWCFTMEYVDGADFLHHVRFSSLRPENVPTLAPKSSLRAPATAGAPGPPKPETRPVQSESAAPASVDSSRSDIEQPCFRSSDFFDEEKLRTSLRQLAEGVHALHVAGKLHRDIKPSNVLVDSKGRVVLLDFGLVAEVGSLPEGAGREVVGTILYMSPEQAAGLPVSPASDWYSVSVMLYEALTGQLPFSGSPWRVLLDKQRRDPPPPRALVAQVPADLDALCMELLRRDPRQRPDGQEVLRRLAGLPSGVGSQESGVSNKAGSSLLTPDSCLLTPGLVGRQAHLTTLREAFEEARRGRAVTVCVHGRSGMGKSSLVQAFLGELEDRNEALVFRGRNV